MQLKIGSIIKELRTRQKITQEQLATCIGVTPQAISRWEAENGYPDIETLPAIAAYFSVTVDTLLGIQREDREERLAEIYRKIDENGEMGLGKEVLTEARLFAAEFPSDEKIQENLADTLCRGFMWDDVPDKDRLTEAEKIYQVLLETTRDNDFRCHILESLAYLYAVGFRDRDKLTGTVEKLPLLAYSREQVGAHAFYALDKSSVRMQDYIDKLTDSLATTIEQYTIDCIPNGTDMWDTKVTVFEKLIDLYKFVYGENLLFYHSRVSGLYRVIATYKVAQGKYDETLDCLEKMLWHIREKSKVKPGDRHDSLFTTALTYGEALPGLGEFDDLSVHNEAWYALNGKLSQSRYDPIREMPRFVRIVEELTALAE